MLNRFLIPVITAALIGCTDNREALREDEQKDIDGALGLTADGKASSHESTLQVVNHGKECTASSRGSGQRDCRYRIGRDLEILVAGVGQDDAAVNFLRAAGMEGDYWGAFGMHHLCVIVKPGGRTTAENPDRLIDLVFISPANGNVYSDWWACAETVQV